MAMDNGIDARPAAAGEIARRYGFALLASAGALALTAVLRPWLGQTIYLFFYPAVMVSAWRGGFGPGAAAGLLGAASAAYFFLTPTGNFQVQDAAGIATVVVLIATAWAIDRMRLRVREAYALAENRATHAEQLTHTLEEQAIELEMQVEANQALVADLEDTNHRLLTAATQAQAANRAKSAFLATMSHELRTPLNAIDGYAELLEMEIYGPVTEKQRAAVGRIRYSHNALLALIDQVLDQAKLEAGRLEIGRERVPVEPLLADAAGMIAPQANEKGLRVSWGCDCPDLAALADRGRASQILLNLLSNAVKFTETGGEIELVGAEVRGWVEIGVRDTGVGIPADKLESVFEPFVQVDQSPTRTVGGAGLGLAISRDLARAMGGDLEVASTSGTGSTFSLRLPAASG